MGYSEDIQSHNGVELAPEYNHYFLNGRFCTSVEMAQRAQSLAKTELDPNGKSAHSPGAKLDSGKNRPFLVLSGFSRALAEVSKVGTFGANKYSDNGWKEVPNGINRYGDAKMRHLLAECSGENFDSESTFLHAAHEAWNTLARLELILREREKSLTA